MALLVQTENVVWCETVVQTVQQREVSYTSINYTGMCVYLHLKMFMCWSSLSAITLPPATGLVETHEVKEIKAHFTRSEVSCRQVFDHECIERTRSELNISHLELAFPGAQRTEGREFTWLRP